MSWTYLIALTVDIIGLLVALYFVISDGIRYARSGNGMLPLLTLIVCGWVGTSFYLYHHGHPKIAGIMAWIPALPLMGYGLFALMFIVFKPNMR
jgi:hypothetical protein